MKFAKDTAYGLEIGDRFGEYVESFSSDHGQVTAELFKQGNRLVAYVSFVGVTGTTVTDHYIVPLNERAAELGFRDRFGIVYAGS